MTTATGGIRPACAADVPAMSRMLARAFADDGMIDWLAGPRGAESDARRDRRSAALFTGYLRLLALPHGMAWVVDGADGTPVAGALWSPPGCWHPGPLTQLRLTPYFVATTGLRRLPTRFLAAQTILGAHPAEPHYYLQVLGVDPAAQGSGLGTSLLRRGLQVADAAGVPCYLETMNGDNVSYYQHHGFRLQRELRLPYSGHPVWLLWREAGGPK